MASLTPWTWIWASSGRWWGTGKPSVLQSSDGTTSAPTVEAQSINHRTPREIQLWHSGESSLTLSGGAARVPCPSSPSYPSQNFRWPSCRQLSAFYQKATLSCSILRGKFFSPLASCFFCLFRWRRYVLPPYPAKLRPEYTLPSRRDSQAPFPYWIPSFSRASCQPPLHSDRSFLKVSFPFTEPLKYPIQLLWVIQTALWHA